MSEVTGKIKMVGDTQTFEEKGFRKRELVVTTEEQYPQHILIEFVQDKCDLLDAYRLGENVKVGINLRGREWVNPQGETKYFNSVQGWRIDKLGSTPQPYDPNKDPNSPKMQEQEEDDLPF